MPDDTTPRDRARAMSAKLYPPGGRPAERLVAPAEIFHDWNVLSRDTVLGNVWSRPGLPTRERSLITVAMLTVLNMPNELRLHIRGATNQGISRAEIGEVIMHSALYGGWPTAVEGMRIAAEEFAEADAAAG